LGFVVVVLKSKRDHLSPTIKNPKNIDRYPAFGVAAENMLE
jgi:hypothetical protein